MITIQKYIRAQSLEEAYQLNQNRRSSILGGMLWLKMGSGTAGTAIDLCNLGLDTIEESDEEFSIGAMVTLRQLEQHSGLNAYTNGAVAAAVKDIVGVQFRNLATIGGSLWGRFGFSDVLTVFLVMDCSVELYKGGIIPLEQFAALPYDRDLLVRVIVKKNPARFVYSSVRNQRTDFPVLACAAARVGGEYRLTVGARPGRAVLLRDRENLLAAGLTPEAIKAFGRWASEQIPTQSNLRGSAEYRTRLIRVLAGRNLQELKEEG